MRFIWIPFRNADDHACSGSGKQDAVCIQHILHFLLLAFTVSRYFIPLGVSIDSLMVIAPANLVDVIVASLTESNIGVDVIGVVNDSGVTTIESADGEVNVLVPKFREAAYTPVKKVVDSLDSVDFDEGAAEIDRVTREIISKKDEIVRWIRNRYE